MQHSNKQTFLVLDTQETTPRKLMNWTLSQIRTISLRKILKTKQRDEKKNNNKEMGKNCNTNICQILVSKMHKQSCNTRMWIAQFKYKILKQTLHKRMYVYDK